MPEKTALATATETKCLEIYNPKYMHASPVLQKALHPTDALGLKGVVSLAGLAKQIGSRKVEALIKAHLLTLNDLLGLNKPLTPAQIDFIAAQAVAIHHNLSMVDIHIICKRAATGYYGELYESLTPPKVLKWFAAYFEERCQAAEGINATKHMQFKESPHEERQCKRRAASISEGMARAISGMPKREEGEI